MLTKQWGLLCGVGERGKGREGEGKKGKGEVGNGDRSLCILFIQIPHLVKCYNSYKLPIFLIQKTIT